jgi:predicted Fe-Mo cluster-binding NifX family protein
MTQNIKIAAPTNNRIALAERSGRAKEFAVVEIENGQVSNISYRENHHEHNHDHSQGDHAHGHQDIVEALHDCAAVVGRKFGPHFAGDFHKAGIRLILSKQEHIEAAAMEAYGKL